MRPRVWSFPECIVFTLKDYVVDCGPLFLNHLTYLFSSLSPTASTKARAKKKCDNNTKNESADVYYVDPGIALFSVFGRGKVKEVGVKIHIGLAVVIIQ